MSVTKKSPHAKLARLAEGVLGRSVARIEKPGGSRRQSCRLVLDDDERVIATRRDELSQAVLEVRVLKLLADNDAPVPSVLASRGDFLVPCEDPDVRGMDGGIGGDETEKTEQKGFHDIKWCRRSARPP